MKQTAVEWQFEQLFNSFEKFNNGECTFNDYLKRNLEIREQAKQIEQENIISGLKILNITLKEAYEAGQKSMYCGCYDIVDADSFEDYVNGKLKQQEQ
jgi:hypothetical protein